MIINSLMLYHQTWCCIRAFLLLVFLSPIQPSCNLTEKQKKWLQVCICLLEPVDSLQSNRAQGCNTPHQFQQQVNLISQLFIFYTDCQPRLEKQVYPLEWPQELYRQYNCFICIFSFKWNIKINKINGHKQQRNIGYSRNLTIFSMQPCNTRLKAIAYCKSY